MSNDWHLNDWQCFWSREASSLGMKSGWRELYCHKLYGTLLYRDDFLNDHDQKKLFDQLMQRLPWQQEQIKLFGKVYDQPRLTAWLGLGLSAKSRYQSSIPASPWWPDVELVRHSIAIVCRDLVTEYHPDLEHCQSFEFNSALCNLYRDGRDAMGMHADDEPAFGVMPQIASLSLGATRQFVCHHRMDKALKIKTPLKGGSLLLMLGGFQHHWKHGVPREAQSRGVGPRINLTFRTVGLKEY